MRDADAFPGPAAAAPAKKLKEYVEARAADGDGGSENHGERLLWTVVALSLQFKVRVLGGSGNTVGFVFLLGEWGVQGCSTKRHQSFL